MVYLSYDGTFEGFFTAIFEVYERKLVLVQICKNKEEIPSFFVEKIEVHTDLFKAKRVVQKIEQLSTKEGVELLWKCYLSEITGIENAMLGAIRYLLKSGKNIFSDFGDPQVLTLRETEKKIGRESHRMTAFVRFQLGTDGLYYALIAPDFDVLPLIIDHFKGRYADQCWLIFDTKRKYGIYYDLDRVDFIQPQTAENRGDVSGMLELKEEESLYQLLWKDYFKSTNIQARKNMKLHLQHVPKRYWKYLTEKLG